MPVIVPSAVALDRFSEIGDLGASMRRLLTRIFLPLVVLLSIGIGFTWYNGQPGAAALALISLGSLVVLAVWNNRGIGIPTLPMFALQHLLAYGLPILIGQEVTRQYPEAFIFDCGVEVLVFSLTLAAAWRFGMEMMRPASPICYALQGVEKEGMQKLERLGINMVLSSLVYQILQRLNLLDSFLRVLPTGSLSMINVLVAGLSTCGFFLSATMLGRGQMSSAKQGLFWLMLTANCLFSASSFLISSAATYIFSTVIGLIWGSGRVPWRFLTVVMLCLSFLSAGKYTMRDRYWSLDGMGSIPEFSLAEMPAHYAEWTEASVAALTGQAVETTTAMVGTKERPEKAGSILDRINNLQNLLWVVNSLESKRIEPLHGATYLLIPPLLVPRILWPDKPRAHEGQVLLNVHFGRQDLESTTKAYIAWGLLAEAYGNFGPYLGAIFIGAVLGLFSAWMENLTARKLLFSLEGFLCFTVFLGLVNSFEMVASVLVTSIFQAVVPIIIASTPFVERISVRRPTAESS